MPHFKDPQNKVHFLDDARYVHLLPAGCVGISDAEADVLRAPPPKTPTEIKRESEQAEIEIVRTLPMTKALRRMTRADVLAAVDAAFPAGAQRNIVRQLALVAWASAVERDRDDA